jgi:hypothetical protein
MVEGPESRWALHNYPLESLFLSHRNMLLIYIDKIQAINEFIGSWTKIFIENVQRKVSTDIEVTKAMNTSLWIKNTCQEHY